MMMTRRTALAVHSLTRFFFTTGMIWWTGALVALLPLGLRAQQAAPTPNLQPFQPFQPDTSSTGKPPVVAAPKEPEVRRALPVNPGDAVPDITAAPSSVIAPRAVPTTEPSAITVLPPAATAAPSLAAPSPAPRRSPRSATAATVPAARQTPPVRSAYPAPGTDAPNDFDVTGSSGRMTSGTAPSSPASAARSYPAPGTDVTDGASATSSSSISAASPTETPALAQQRRPASRSPSNAQSAADAPSTTSDAGGGSADSSDEIRIAPQAPGTPALPPDEVQFNLANSFYLRKQYNQAAAEYERYLGLYANGSRRQAALWWVGECYRNLNRTSAARSSYQNLVIAYTDGEFVGPANFRLATIDYGEKDYKTALPLFQRSATLAKTDDVKLSSRYFEALCLENLDRRDETREVYEDIISIGSANNPYRDAARLSLAQLAMSQKRSNEAFKQYEALSREAAKPGLKVESAYKAGLLAKEIGQNDTAAVLLSGVGAMPGATADLRADAQLALLHLLYDINKYQRLLESYPAAKRDLPESSQAEALLLAANSQRQLGKHAEAQTFYAQLVAQYPRSPLAAEARYQRIISLYASNNANFVKEADDYLTSNPPAGKADQVRLMKADTLFKKGDYAGAAPSYDALDGSTNLSAKYRAEAAYRLGYCYAQLRQPEQTINAFTHFLGAFPDHPFTTKALVQRAVALQQLKRYDAALKDFNDIITDHREAKEREIALQQKALILGQQDDSRGMADAFRTLLKEYPKTDAVGMANFYIGRSAFDAKDYATALSSFEAARKANPKEYGSKASLSIIVCQYQLRDKDTLAKEIDAYQKAGAAQSSAVPPEVLRWLGEQEYDEKDYASAERYLSGAAQINPTPDLLLMLIRSRLNLGKWDPALEASRRYLEITAAAEPAVRAVGLLAQGDAQLGLKKYDDAQKNSDAALQLQPEGTLNAKARLLSGRIAFARGEYDAAGKSFMSVAVLYDDPEITPQALRQAAEAFDKAGKTAEATKADDELKSRFPNYTAIRQP